MCCSIEEATEILNNAECCYTPLQISDALDKIAASITEKFETKNPLVLCVMTGGLVTTAELILRLHFRLQYDYMHATRYRGDVRGGELRWLAKPSLDLANRHIIIVDDIYDEGITLTKIKEYCEQQNAASVASMVMVNKIHDRKFGPIPDYIGLDVEDRYVFGFGMDYKGHLRNVPGIFAVKET